MYPADMEKIIRKVEATRERRLKETFPRLNTEERTTLVHKYHPDFITEGMRELQVGPNRGERTPNELADLLEGNSRIDPDKIDLDKIDYDVDVLVIGGGGAGASAALLAQENGAEVLLITKLRLGDANTVGAQGGTQAADRPNDSPAIHYLDTVGGGGFTNVPELVVALVKDAPSVIKWLETLGVNWDKAPNGSFRELPLGGLSRKRVHSAGDYTGLEIMRTLRDEIYNREIDTLEFSVAVELVMDDNGRVAGAILVNLETNELYLVRAKSVILTTGGIGRLHIQGFPTTNHYGATADGLVLAYRVGAELIFIDTMQYHPTGAAYPVQIVGQLVTEKVRSLGAQLVNIDSEQFIHPLETRDVVASAIIRECQWGKGVVTQTGHVSVWLDSPMIDLIHGEETIARELPAMVRQFNRFNIDMTKEPILVYPTLHYQNGGIKIDTNGATTVPGLFAAGECGGGVHGRNRLAGNSTLDTFVFGRRAGRAAAHYAKEVKLGPLTIDHVYRWQRELEQAGLAHLRSISPLLLPNYARHMPDYLSDHTKRALSVGQVKIT
ncbi:MAG: Fumarate reductase flavoprotein subunit [Syntrophomonadaceae bacterium]|nr:Fumarate reductase flavoprotein subunit [Bacillota bacterium]MBT9146707.1 Fumarate reductase flavoprotein subunit [Bacillota bacterium]